MINLQIIVLAVICFTCLSVRGPALCSTSKSTLFNRKTIIYTNYFCCRNFEKKNGTCIECQRGYTTSNGEPCKECTANKFGNKCAYTCHCIEEERCDNRHGCVPLHPQISTDRLSTLMYDIQQTTDPMNSSKQTMKFNIIYNESHQTSTYDYENKTYSNGYGKPINDSDFINYVIWTGCILFIILIVVSSSICYRLNKNLLLKHFANVNSALQEMGSTTAVTNRSESVPGPYNTINEQTMCLDQDIEIQVVQRDSLGKHNNKD